MILYFSGTGNSRYTAQAIGTVTGDKPVSLNNLIKTGSKKELKSEKPFVFVCPTYAWRVPKIVERFIRTTPFTGNKKAYFVLTCGDSSGNAAYYAKKLCKAKGLEFMGLATIVMPENYIAMFDVPDKTASDEIISKAEPHIFSVAKLINAEKMLVKEKYSLVGVILSSIVNPLFYMACVSAKGFYSTDNCTGCSKCVNLCPLSNIKLVDGRPQWGNTCTHCMACICGCPNESIEYKNKSKGKPRYFLDGYHEYKAIRQK